MTSLPIIAAGGLADGASLPAILALGGDAVAMGTRWAMTQESPLHENTRQIVMKKTVHDTIYTSNFDGMPCRIMKTPTGQAVSKKPLTPWRACWEAFKVMRAQRRPWSELITTIRQEGLLGAIKLAYFGAAVERIRVAILDGDQERGVQLIGQAQGLINDVPACAELMQRLLQEAEEAHRQVVACASTSTQVGVHSE